MNAMGACAQLMGLDGTLRWAFVPDPQRQTRVFVKDEAAAAQVAGARVEALGDALGGQRGRVGRRAHVAEAGHRLDANVHRHGRRGDAGRRLRQRCA